MTTISSFGIFPFAWGSLFHDWADLKRVFVGNFQGTHVRPGNSWDLKSYQHEPSESLWDYICRFFQRCNSLPDVVDTDVINAFLSGTT